MSTKDANEKHYHCPFPSCKHPFSTNRALKQHLRSLKGGGFDLEHPPNHPEWERLEKSSFLTLHRRPGNLSAEDKRQRRLTARKLHYQRHKDSILEDARQKREQERKIKDAIAMLGPVYLELERACQILAALLGPSPDFHISKFVDIVAPPTV